MAEPKAKTLQERFGFLDADLKKPKHDEIMHWVDANIDDVLMIGLNLQRRPKAKTTWEKVVRSSGSYSRQIIGFVDLFAHWEDAGEYIEYRHCAMEVKTEIPSLGELIRQIRMYQAGEIEINGNNRIRWLVVSPDDSHAEKLREQGINFFKYDPAYTFPVGGV